MQQGLTYMQLKLQSRRPLQQINKKMVIPIFSFINQIIALLKQYSQDNSPVTWADYLIYHKKSSHLILLIHSWLSHCPISLQCQLLSSLLLSDNRNKINIYLRLRKYIAQLGGKDMLDEIVLRHEDVITVVHRMFSSVVRKQIIGGVKQIFIAYKIAEAKIYACVLIQYILSVYDTASSQEQSIMAGQTKVTQTVISNFSSINNFNSNIHPQNGLYRKVECNDNIYNIIETKFIPRKTQKKRNKFNEDNSSYYYSNSLNYIQQNSSIAHNSHLSQLHDKTDKQNMTVDLMHRNQLSLKSGKQIKIEEMQYLQEKSITRSNLSQYSIELLVSRNQEFKDKMLTDKKYQLQKNNHKEQDSISDTINIIHNSIVKHRRIY